MSGLRAAVVGAGHLGKHHARILSSMEGVQLVAVADPDRSAGEAAASASGAAWFTSPGELLAAWRDDLDAVTIAAPTSLHAEVAAPFLEAGIATLVEKPLTSTSEEGHRLVGIAQGTGVLLQVGHLERFNPAYQAMKASVRKPGFVEAERLGVFTGRSLDVDVVKDVMIHDLDLIFDLMGGEPESIDAVGLPVLTGRVDIARVRLRFPGGGVADLAASRISAEKVRKLRVFDPSGQYFSVDLQAQTVDAVRVDRGAVPPSFQRGPLDVQPVEPLRAELASFMDCVRTGTRPAVSGEDGLKALAWAERIVADLQRGA